MKIISLLFYFSGIAALTYEVLWVRHLGLIFGNTVYAAATVMMTYMFGLAVGARFAGRLAQKIKKPVQMFGILEIFTALYALCVPLIFDFIQLAYRYVAVNISDSMLLLTVLRVSLALILLLIPTAMMGATLPVLSKGFLTKVEKFGSRLGLLYGINTLGAVSGVLLAGFFFIPKLGMSVSNYVAVGLDALVGIISLFLSRKFDARSEIACESSTLDEQHYSAKKNRKAYTLLFALGASGFISLALEVVWFRALILVFGSTTYSFSAMLGIFLVGLSLGSLIISRFADRIKNPAFVFGVSALLIGLFTMLSLHWFTKMPEFLLSNLMLSGEPTWDKMIGLKFVITLIFLLIPTLLFGASFTAATKAIREAMNSSPVAVGEAAMFNTIGAALGAFFGGFILLPNTGIKLGLIICAMLILFLGLLLILRFSTHRTSRFISIGATVIAILVLFIAPPTWDKQVMSSGPYFSPWNFIDGDKITLEDQLKSERLLYFNEGITSTISVIQTPDEIYSYCSQGKVEADTSERSMMLQRMMGHLPMLFHPDPQRVVNIGLGAGVTFGAVSCYPAEHLEVVEFEPSVVNIAQVWSNYNHAVISNPNVTVTINDGRNHLFVEDEPYDVITSDPFEPVMAGAANLYTVDFFELAKSRLADGGIMAQYLPLYELSEENYASIIKSFVKVFPESTMFFTGFDTIMLGFKTENQLDFKIAERKYNEISKARASLQEIGFNSPEMLLSMYVAQLGQVSRKEFDKYDFNTDLNPLVEFSAPKHTFHYTSHRNQSVLMELFSPIDASLLNQFDTNQVDLMKKNNEALQLVLRANLLREDGNLNQSMQVLFEAEKLIDDNPVVKNEIVSGYMTAASHCQSIGDVNNAIHYFKKVLEYNEKEFWALYHLVNLHMQVRDIKSAVDYLNIGIEKYYPESPLFIGLRGKIRATLGDIEGGIMDIQTALEILPNSEQLRSDLNLFSSLLPH